MKELFQIPRGTQDVYGIEARKWKQLEDLFDQFCFVYNYDEIRTPIFEHTNVFKRGNDSSDMVNKEMYTFTLENSKTSLTLRPEMTAGVVRSFVEKKMYANADLPVKLYYAGPQFRHERPQKGRMRMFNQFGVEILGAKDAYLDVEAIVLGYSFVKSIGLNDVRVLINTLGDKESRDAYRSALKEHFRQDIDTLCDDCKRRYEQNPLRILDCKVDHNKPIMKQAPNMQDFLNSASKKYFNEVLSKLDEMQIPYEIDERLVRGLDYYSDTVFEVVSTNTSMGAQGTIFAGGRYDGLISYFGGPEMSGIGWGMGIERLLLACEAEGIELAQTEPLDAYILCLSENAKSTCFSILTELRLNGYRCDMDYMNRSFKAQFRSVERTQAKFALIIGDKDIQENTISVKNIQTQKQDTLLQTDIISFMDSTFQEYEGEKHCHCEEEK